MAATKTKSKSSKTIARAVGRHPFAPESTVGIWPNEDVAGTGGEPAPDPLVTAKVAKDASLEIKVPKKGIYVVGGETEGGYKRISVHVN